ARLSGAGVALRGRPAAALPVLEQGAGLHRLDDRRPLCVPELAEVEVARLAVEPLVGVNPAEEDVARGLHQPLTLDDALAVVGVLALADERLEHRGLCLLGLEEQGVVSVTAEQEHDPGPRADAADAYDLTGEVDDPVALDQLAPVPGEGAPVLADQLLDPLARSRSALARELVDRGDQRRVVHD